MKTSNKLLLGILLTMLILTSVVQLMVYAKFKRGEYAKFNREQFQPMTTLELPAVHFISVKGLGGCAVMPADKLKVEIPKDDAGPLKYQVVNDTLVIIGDSTQTVDLERGSRNNHLVNIYLSASVQLKGSFSSFRVWGTTDSVTAPSYTIGLYKNSNMFFDYNGPKSSSGYFNQVNVNSEQSTIDLNKHIILNDLKLQLFDNSRMNDNGGIARKMAIDADNSSFINLSGKNIKALK